MSASAVRRVMRFACALVSTICAFSVHAQPSLSAYLAKETRGGIERAEIGMSFPTGLAGQLGSAAWAATFNLDVARWHATHDQGRSHTDDIGVTPQLRFVLERRGGFEPFVDLGVGAHWLSARELGELQLGSQFQFGEYLGIGAVFGERRQYTVALRLLHESNCGTNGSNSGLTALGVRFEYTLP